MAKKSFVYRTQIFHCLLDLGEYLHVGVDHDLLVLGVGVRTLGQALDLVAYVLMLVLGRLDVLLQIGAKLATKTTKVTKTMTQIQNIQIIGITTNR